MAFPMVKPEVKIPTYYKQIAGVKYDKILLDLADQLMQGPGDGRISKQDAAELWQDAQDGQGVTEVERKTIQYIADNFNCTDAARMEFASLLLGSDENNGENGE